MGLISRAYTYLSGAIILASEQNTNEDTLYTLVNGQIDNANISATASISATKLATIATAGKVSGAALTLLASTPSAAGIIPIANLPKGNSANQLVSCGTDGVLPALNGSLLTNVPAGTITDASLGTGTASASNFLRGDRTWAAVSTGAPVTSAFTANVAGVSYNTSSANIVSVSKTITSGNTVYINASGYNAANTTLDTVHTFILYAGATSIQTIVTNTESSGFVSPASSWAVNGIVTSLSGATTFKVIGKSGNSYANIAYGNLTVLEF